jgi:hypothetical protein
MWVNKKYWTITSVCEDNITQCSLSCLIIGEGANWERLNNGRG